MQPASSRNLPVPSTTSAHLAHPPDRTKPRHAEQHTHNVLRIGDTWNDANGAQSEPQEHKRHRLLESMYPVPT